MFSWILDTAKRRHLIPRISPTERQALEAGTVWVDGELFSGKPDWRRLLREPYPQLEEREVAFLEGPVEEVCRRVDAWELSQQRELPAEVWSYLKHEGFFGLAIPREHGGHGFSALALSTIFAKLATRSLALSAVVVIPNSVGPAELLLEYGTDEQKRHYLPRLARGEEIPCFALTEPEAGSDAASIRSRGVVFRSGDGELRLRLSWEKRYITLAPVATLLGLAFRLEDPEKLLGRGSDPGITVALVPTDLPGVEIGDYHDPMGVPMPNGPVSGRDVVVSVSQIIGGPDYAGKGWRMLMEALSGGRAISLPAQSTGGAKRLARVVAAYTSVRQQFGTEIRRFEGIEERLARIAGLSYLMEAARVYTCGAVDAGERPAVLSAIMKYQQTELARQLTIDAMDMVGGAAICRGPRNLLAQAWAGAPIGITVEGANILTRTLIAFGQGLIRCHPHAYREVRALEDEDPVALRKAMLGHLRFFLGNTLRAALLSVTRGRLASAPVSGPTARYYRRLSWAAARFAALGDLALLALGPRLKLKEKLSGRFADALSWMYLGAATLRRYEAEGRRAEDLPLVQWALEHALGEIQRAFEGIYRNFEGPVVGALARSLGALWCRLNPLGSGPTDALGARAAAVLAAPGEQLDRLTDHVFVPRREGESGFGLERAFELAHLAAPVLRRIAKASRRGEIPKGRAEERVEEALAAGVLSPQEAELVRQARGARLAAIQVDAFAPAEYHGRNKSRSSPGRREEPATVPA